MTFVSWMKKYGCWFDAWAGFCKTGATTKRTCTWLSVGSTSPAATVIVCESVLTFRLAPVVFVAAALGPLTIAH